MTTSEAVTPDVRRMRFWLAAAILFAAAFVVRSQFIVVSDNISWFLHGAGVLLGDQPFHAAFFEENPPLIVYMHVPAVWLAAAGLGRADAFLLITHILALISFALTVAQLGRTEATAPVKSSLIVVLAFLVLVFPGPSFGDREHLLVLFAMPYFALLAARLGGADPGWPVAAAVTLFACLGFLLKPHFLAALAAALAYGVYVRREFYREAAADVLIVAAAVLAYVAFIAVFHPAYLSAVVPQAIEFYQGQFSAADLVTTFFLTGLPVIVLAAGLVGGGHRRGVFLAAAGGFAAAYLVQGKGYAYHLLPALTLAGLAFAAGLVDGAAARSGTGPPTPGRTRAVVLGVALFLAGGPVYGVYAESALRPAFERQPFVQYLRGRHAGHAVVVATTNFSVPFPAITYAGVEWASRYGGLWMLPGLYENGGLGQPAVTMVLGELAEDIEAAATKAVFIDRLACVNCRSEAISLPDILAGDRRIEAALQSYRRAGEVDRFVVYERRR